ncbi:hypothetical protein RhiJN_21363 [Ceratobasidium sp. AG-Ba]|nr:hypothetical protein RhiJN_21363 [Ceratobasidium sp. AG-Ba]
MASQRPVAGNKKTRYRINDIALDPTTSEYDVEVKIQVDEKTLHKLKIGKGRTLYWGGCYVACDMSNASILTIQVTEIHTFRDKNQAYTYTTSMLCGQDSVSTDRGTGTYSIRLGFIGSIEAERMYQEALVKARHLESQPSVVQRLGKIGSAFKTLLDLGGAMADLDPTGGAKVAFGLCSKAWEQIEQQDRLETELKGCIQAIADMIPSIEDVKPIAKTSLAETAQEMSDLIEDISLFVLNYQSQNAWRRLWSSTVGSSPQERVQNFSDALERLRKTFDTKVSVQTLSAVQAASIVAAEATLRSKLQPASQAGYDPSRACMPGTRKNVIDDAMAWIVDKNTDRRFGWMYGLAGFGKSSIATSVCEQIEARGALGASFFCKRDSPELRDPRRLIATVTYCMAVTWNAYGNMVTAVLEKDPQLHTRHIQPLYEALIAKPMRALSHTGSPDSGLVVVIDALDECGDSEGRGQLLACLRDMSQIGSWLKILVTSRPDSDIQQYFGEDAGDWFMPFSLLRYDALTDIRTFTYAQLGKLEKIDDWPNGAVDQLTERSNGLFIWARTACKYILGGHNPRRCLDRVLAGERGHDSTAQLDSLYATAVRTASGDDEDNLSDILEFLGLIMATAVRTPLSVQSLSLLLRGRISEYRLNHMLSSLSSVLYMDRSHEGVVRVSHPSFMDYVSDKKRSKELCVDLESRSAELAECCIETMKKELRFNICDLDTSHRLNIDVPDLSGRAKSRIGPHLRYSCTYWTSHLVQTKTGRLNEAIEKLLCDHVCTLGVALSSMVELQNIRTLAESSRMYARDVYRFVLSFYDAISTSTPHLYISALALAPEKSLLAQLMRTRFFNTFFITQGAQHDWTPCIRTISVGSGVNSVAWSAVGRKIATGSDDGAVRLWDAETGASVLESIQAHSRWVWSVAFSPDGRLIVSGSADATVRVWDTETGTEVLDPLEGHSGSVRCVTFSPSGAFIASGYDDGSVRVSDTETGQSLYILNRHEGPVLSVAFSADGRRLASGSADKTVRLWDVDTGAMALEPLTGHTGDVCSVAFSTGGHRIVSGAYDCTIRVWDANAGSALRVITGHSSAVLSVAFLLDDRRVVSGSGDGTVRTWDADTGAQLSLFLGHSTAVWSVGCSPDGRRIVSGSDDKTVRIWDTEVKDTAARVPQGHSDLVHCVAFSPDGRRIASCSDDTTIRIWDAATGAAAMDPIRGHLDYIYSIAYSPDGRRIVSGSDDKTVRVWDAETGAAVSEPLQGHTESGHSKCVYSVAFSPDGCHLVSGSGDSTIRLWDTSNGMSVLEPLRGHGSKVNCVAYSPDGQRIASCSDDCTIRIWDAKTGVPLLEPIQGHLSTVTSVVFSSDGQHILSSSHDKTLRIWDAKTGRLLREPLGGHDWAVYSAVFSPDGCYVASGSNDRSVRVWNVDECVDSETTAQRHLPGTEILTLSRSTDAQPVSTGSLLARRMRSDGWATTPDGGLYVWLPPDLRRVDDSVICISVSPPRARVVMDFSRFVHGKEWTSVAGGEVGL